MKYILALGLLLGFHGSVNADWNSWETLPKNNQLYMVVHIEPFQCVKERQTLIIDRWNCDSPIFFTGLNGWWDVSPEDIEKWINEDSKLVYLPRGKNSLNSLSYLLMTLDSDLDQDPGEF